MSRNGVAGVGAIVAVAFAAGMLMHPEWPHPVAAQEAARPTLPPLQVGHTYAFEWQHASFNQFPPLMDHGVVLGPPVGTWVKLNPIVNDHKLGVYWLNLSQVTYIAEMPTVSP